MDLERQDQPTMGDGRVDGSEVVKRSKHERGGKRLGAFLGIQNKKNEFLRRGSPRLRSVLSAKQRDVEKSRRRGLSSTNARGKLIKDDGSMGSKNPSHRH